MKIRDYQWTDEQRIKEMYLSAGLDERCVPDLKSHLYIIKKVVEDNHGKVQMGGFIRATCEPFLVLDHKSQNPNWRWGALRDLTDCIATVARTKGLEQATTWIQPELEASFGKRLEMLGFARSPWVSYTRNLLK